MRYIILSVFFCCYCLYPVQTKAACRVEGITIWPSPDKPLPTNPTIIVSLYGSACKYINLLSADSAVIFRWKREVVQLRCVDIIINDSNIHQLIYKPVKLLRDHENYTIDFIDSLIDIGIISSLFRYQLSKCMDGDLNPKASSGVWRTEEYDLTPPLFSKRLIKIKKIVGIEYCYQPNQVLFKHDIFESGALVFKFILRRKDDTTTYTYYCPTMEAKGDELISIGTDGLFFPFKLGYGDKFQGTVQAMDAAGNFSKEIHPISFRFRRKYYMVLTVIRQKLLPFETL